MFLDYAWLPPEINSARIFGGVGSGPLAAAGSAWEALAADLRTSAAAFESVITGLASGPWAGPSAVSMAAAATPYIGWLSAAAAQAEAAASQAQAAATAFETALVATVHPGAVSANRVSLVSLVATNFLGQNAPAIAATEFDYVEMWAQDVGAMVGYESGAQSVAAALVPFSVPPLDLAGLVSTASAGVAGIADGVTAAVSPVVEGALVAGSGVVAGVQSLASALPLQSVISVAQAAATPASMLIGPLMQAGQSASANTAALAGATAADVPKFVGDTAPAVGGLGGGGGLGRGRRRVWARLGWWVRCRCHRPGRDPRRQPWAVRQCVAWGP
ncbi:PPE family protein PPE38 [Mycobacterium intermedium]